MSLARALIGRTIVHVTDEGMTGGRIVEVEAYRGDDDPGSHAFRRVTARNMTMFGPPGHLYVYFSYGMHHCANVVAEKRDVPGAVLLRALEPTIGLDLMQARRGAVPTRDLARGPGRLCQAMGLTVSDDGMDLVAGDVWITRARRVSGEILASSRIGIRQGLEHRWRFYEKGPWVSRP